jgi:hypothetical protein
MLVQYSGGHNEGVGRSLLPCPLCRGSYCFNDLTSVRVAPVPSPDEVKKPSKRPADAEAVVKRKKVKATE